MKRKKLITSNTLTFQEGFTEFIYSCKSRNLREGTCNVCMLLSSGIRLRSLINIRIKDIDFENEVAYIQHTKNRKALIVPLNASILKVLKECITLLKLKRSKEYNPCPSDFFFCNLSYDSLFLRNSIPFGVASVLVNPSLVKVSSVYKSLIR